MRDYLTNYYLFINTLTLIISGIDKIKAKHAKWRIKESTLYMLSFLGGAFGMVISMLLFRHKTQKNKFIVIISLAFALHLFILCLVVYKDFL
ncbi:MAG: Putative membrane protein [Clostridiales bacterium 38_11]|nr:MAG: Putative membrane protein [Clostridiales bacterium 38_11]HBH11513.1 DUF1294 domain-containing protein [Clostridiales bacterium]